MHKSINKVLNVLLPFLIHVDLLLDQLSVKRLRSFLRHRDQLDQLGPAAERGDTNREVGVGIKPWRRDERDADFSRDFRM